jgi:cell division protein FtsB
MSNNNIDRMLLLSQTNAKLAAELAQAEQKIKRLETRVNNLNKQLKDAKSIVQSSTLLDFRENAKKSAIAMIHVRQLGLIRDGNKAIADFSGMSASYVCALTKQYCELNVEYATA